MPSFSMVYSLSWRLWVAPSPPDAERRHLTVLFWALGDSTRLAGRLAPEDLREVIPA
jgi:hypothetical protein